MSCTSEASPLDISVCQESLGSNGVIFPTPSGCQVMASKFVFFLVVSGLISRDLVGTNSSDTWWCILSKKMEMGFPVSLEFGCFFLPLINL